MVAERKSSALALSSDAGTGSMLDRNLGRSIGERLEQNDPTRKIV
jgi:hypothetical protein